MISDSPSASAARVPPVRGPRAISLVPLATGVVAVGVLYVAKDVLVPIVLAVLLAFVLAPVVALLKRIGIGRTPAVIVAMALALGLVGLTGLVIGQQVAGLAADLPRYAERVQDKVEAIGKTRFGRLPDQISRIAGRFQQQTNTPPARRIERRARPIPVEVHDPPESGWAMTRRLLAPVVGPLETLAIVLVVAVFVLIQREDLRDRVIRLFGSTDLHRTTQAIDEAAARLSRYFLTQLALNTAFGGFIALGLSLIDLSSPLLWGLLAGLLRFVPYVGAFLAVLPPLLLATGAEPGWTLALLTAALFLTAEPIMGYVVEPLVYGHSTGLSPLAVIVAAIFWTWLWGPIGLLLAVPVTLLLVVIGRHVPQMEFIDVLFGDRPALTPVESFYQRMLAGDEDEVLDQAEHWLKTRALSAYYDEVALPGLRLALADRRRGAVTRECLDEIVEHTRELIEALEPYPDRAPAKPEAPAEPTGATLDEKVRARPDPTAGPSAPALRVAVLTGSGPADAVTAAMLEQLLAKRRMRIVSDGATPDIVCLLGLDIRPASLRWRKLKTAAAEQWPEARIVEGLTRTGQPGHHLLADMIEACMTAPVVAEEGLEPPTRGL